MRVAILLALFACQGSSEPKTNGSAVDPWSGPRAGSDDAPSLSERHKRADEICPSVKAPYFYKVEKDGQVSYLLGTRHVGVALAKFPAVVLERLHAANRVVFEIAPNDRSRVRPPKIDLQSAVGPTLWMHFRELVGTSAASSVTRASPSRALLQMLMMYEDLGAMLEQQLQAEVADKIPMTGLETAAFQDGLIEQLLDLRLLDAAIAVTKTRKELADESRDDLDKYCTGADDNPGLDPMLRTALLASGYTPDDLAHMEDELVFARNADWIPKLETIFATSGAFVAVGADHLKGNRGVVALLAARGYTVTRVTK